ncbi:hypothetical protein DRQ33_01195 [bacterium]|nr:MAG: hypothetical protein DRQ33_01195 [bacterium]
MLKKRLTIIFPIFLILGAIFSQQAQTITTDNILTLEEAEKIALSSNIDVLSASQQYQQASAEYLSVWSKFLPSASASADWRRYDKETIYIRNDQFLYSRDRYSLGLSASFPLFSGGQDIISLKQAKISKDIAKLKLNDVIGNIRYQVYSAYFAFVKATMQYEIARQSLLRAKDEQTIILQKRELGAVSDVDVSKMKVQVAQKKLAKIQAENSVQQAREQLCFILNIPLDTMFIPDTTHIPIPTEEIDDLDSYLTKYDKNREYLQSRLNSNSAKLNYWSSYLNYLPRLTLSGSWGWSGGEMPVGFSELDNDGSSSFGISLSWTLFSGTSRIAAIKSANAQYMMTKYSQQKTRQFTRQQIRDAYRKMLEASASFEVSEVQVEDAELTLSATRQRFEMGSATLLELLDAELMLEQAQFQRVSAITDFYIQKAELIKLIAE